MKCFILQAAIYDSNEEKGMANHIGTEINQSTSSDLEIEINDKILALKKRHESD